MMQHNPHLLAPVERYGAPAGQARLAVLLVHGRGQSPQWVKQMVVNRFGCDNVAWFAPAAADASWYPERFIAPLPSNEPRLSQALQRLQQLSDEVAAQGISHEAQVLMGFSQGACLCSEYAWRSPRRHRALVAFTGGLIGPPGAARDTDRPALRGLPVLLSSWEADPHVPATSVRESADLFTAAGARVRLEIGPGTEHTIRDDEIALARELLAGDQLR
jgi:phospholipase/carboxylesterase